MWGIEFAVITAMVVINAVFAAYEIALTSIPAARLQVLVAEGRRGAKVALRMKQDMESSLAVVQLGITLVGAVAAATGGVNAGELMAPSLEARGLSPGLAEAIAVALVVLPLTGFTIVVGELVPKLFALRNKEWICLRLSRPMQWLSWCVWPAIWLLESSATTIMRWTERIWLAGAPTDFRSEAAELQELRAVANLARAARLIGAREEQIIVSAARLSSRPVREIMLPAEHISMLYVHDSISDCLIAAHLDLHTRFPVTHRRGDPQAISGYVNFKDIVAQMRLSPHDASLAAICRVMPSYPAEFPISAVLESLMHQRTHIALVRDSAEHVLGLVTLEDIIEELVGDIQDEYDLLPIYAVASGIGWVVGGGTPLPHLRELTQFDLEHDAPSNGARHLSAWIIGHLGGPVRGGEIVERLGLRVVVRKVRRQCVLEAQISRVPAAHGTSARSEETP